MGGQGHGHDVEPIVQILTKVARENKSVPNGIKLSHNSLLINELCNHRRDGMGTAETASPCHGAGSDMRGGKINLSRMALS